MTNETNETEEVKNGQEEINTEVQEQKSTSTMEVQTEKSTETQEQAPEGEGQKAKRKYNRRKPAEEALPEQQVSDPVPVQEEPNNTGGEPPTASASGNVGQSELASGGTNSGEPSGNGQSSGLNQQEVDSLQTARTTNTSGETDVPPVTTDNVPEPVLVKKTVAGVELDMMHYRRRGRRVPKK